MIEHIANSEGGGAVRSKLNEVIDLTNVVPSKVDKVVTAVPGNVPIFGEGGVLIDSGETPGGGAESNVPFWEDVQNIPLPEGYLVQFNGRLFASKIDDNLGNQPPLEGDDDYWNETSKSAGGGTPLWVAGQFTQARSEVMWYNPDKLKYEKYLLLASVEPIAFESEDIATEILAGDWQLLGGDSGIVYASKLEAEGNTENTKVMTALRVFENWINNVKTYVISELTTASKTVVGAINWLKSLTDITGEPTGFRYPHLVDVSYNPTTRQVTVTGTTEAYFKGDLISSMVSGWVSDAHSEDDGSYFLYYNGTNYVWGNAPWEFSMLQIALVYRDGVNFCIRECHGLMQHQTHKEFHETLGTYLTAGGDLSGFVLNSTVATNRRPLISAATINDEDLPTSLPAITVVGNYTRLFLDGANNANLTTNADDIINLSGNQPYYNQFTGGDGWQQTLFGNNAYGKIFVMAVPVTSDAECQKNRFIFIQPQTTSTTLATIQAISPSSVNLGHIASALAEYVFIGEIIVRYASNNWTWISSAKLVGTKVLQASIIGGGGGTVVSANVSLSTPLLGATNQDALNVLLADGAGGGGGWTEDLTAWTSAETTVNLTSNVLRDFGTTAVGVTVNITLTGVTSPTLAEYMFKFVYGMGGSFVFPVGITLALGNPTFTGGNSYECTIVRGKVKFIVV